MYFNLRNIFPKSGTLYTGIVLGEHLKVVCGTRGFRGTQF